MSGHILRFGLTHFVHFTDTSMIFLIWEITALKGHGDTEGIMLSRPAPEIKVLEILPFFFHHPPCSHVVMSRSFLV